jgi:hypothetical protein
VLLKGTVMRKPSRTAITIRHDIEVEKGKSSKTQNGSLFINPCSNSQMSHSAEKLIDFIYLVVSAKLIVFHTPI